MSARLSSATLAAERAVAQVCAGASSPESLLAGVAGVVRRVVPYRAAGWILTDPGSGLITAIHGEDVDPDAQRRVIELERLGGDINSFAALAARPTPVGRLSVATRGRLSASRRHRTLYGPLGLGDELRAVVRGRHAVWGQVCLARGAGEPWFTDEEEEFLARAVRWLADGLHVSQAILPSATEDHRPDGPGVLVLGPDDDVCSASADGERLLSALPRDGAPLPSAVHDVAARARSLAADGGGPPAKSVVRSRSGSAVVVRGSVLAGEGAGDRGVAIVLEPARQAELAPMVLAVAGLTPREREVTQLLLAGAGTVEVAQQLWISTHTVRGHIKSSFAKLGVRSRPELCALLGEADRP